MSRKHTIEMTQGPLVPNMLRFCLPLMLSGILQFFFNAADSMVVGKFASSTALAAVGTNGSLTELMVTLFVGISIGTTVLTARYFGARDLDNARKCIHTSMALSAVLSVVVTVVGLFLARPLMDMMKLDPLVYPEALQYLEIYLLGVPGLITYNFGAAILQAVGDTKRPLYYLSFAGVVNVMLNLILVICFHMGVRGVAIATIVSQYISAALVVCCLLRDKGDHRLVIRDLRFYKGHLLPLLQVGIPSGLQNTMFALSNVTIQSSVNSLGGIVTAASAAAGKIDGFIYIGANAFYTAATAFTSQNYGARRYDRLTKVYTTSLGLSVGISAVLSLLVFLFGEPLLSLFIRSDDPNRDMIMHYGMIRLTIIGISYLLCSVMSCPANVLRGLGRSWTPMIITAIGVCLFRIVWVFAIFPLMPNYENIMISYPISWVLTAIVQMAFLLPLLRKYRLKAAAPV